MQYALNDCALHGRDGRWAIGIDQGRIVALRSDGDLCADTCHDLGGRLVSPSFVDAHVHLDKCFTASRTPHAVGAKLTDAIPIVREDKLHAFSVDDVRRRASRALRWSVSNGTGHVRSNVEADPFVELRAIDGVAAAAADLADSIDVQISAFPQEGWFDTPGTLEAGSAPYVRAALANGVRVVGGNVNAALWPSSPEDQVDEIFALALECDADIDMHLDNWDGPEAFTLPYVAEQAVRHGMRGRVTVAHVASLGHVAPAIADDTIAALLAAEINVAVLPARIRLTPARALIDAGVNVLVATDNLRDAFLPFGQADPLEAGLLFALLTQMTARGELDQVWRALTANAAKALRLPEYGIEVGHPADLIVLDDWSASDAVLNRAERLAVFKRGQIVHRSERFGVEGGVAATERAHV